MNKVVHFEIPADDLARARKFYGELFDWNIHEWTMSDGAVYVGVRTVEVDEKTFMPKEPGAINGALVQRDRISQTPQVTVNVASIDECLEKVKAAGGNVLKGKTNVDNMGFYAYVSDTEGNLLGLWEEVTR